MRQEPASPDSPLPDASPSRPGPVESGPALTEGGPGAIASGVLSNDRPLNVRPEIGPEVWPGTRPAVRPEVRLEVRSDVRPAVRPGSGPEVRPRTRQGPDPSAAPGTGPTGTLSRAPSGPLSRAPSGPLSGPSPAPPAAHRRPARRILSLWLPRFAIERHAREATRRGDLAPEDVPLVLALEGQHGPVIHAANRAAEAEGVSAGARVVDMRALVPGLKVEHADPGGDAAALGRLMLWARRWCPWTALDGTGGIAMEITGSDHLWGGEARLMEEIEGRLGALGLTARVAVASSLGAAWALARFGPPRALCPGAAGSQEMAARLGPLPVRALRLDGATVLGLQRLGLRTIGDLAAVPRLALARRYLRAAPEGDPLLRLDQALGRVGEPLASPEEPPRFVAEARLAEPVLDPTAHLPALAETLCAQLAAAGFGARRVEIALYRSDGEVARLSVATSRPSRDPRHLVRLFDGRLERLDPGFGFDLITLAAGHAEAQGVVQGELEGGRRARIAGPLEGSGLAGAGLGGAGLARAGLGGTGLGGTGLGGAGLGGTERAGTGLPGAGLAEDGLAEPASSGIGAGRGGTGARGPDARPAADAFSPAFTGPGEDLSALVDRLAARFGPGALRRPVPRESHIPERRSEWVPAMAAMATLGEGRGAMPVPAGSARSASARPDQGRSDQAQPISASPSPDGGDGEGRSTLPLAPRPVRLLDPPEEIGVIHAVPEGPPVQFVWRRVTFKVTRFAGPERIAPEWWVDQPGTRLRDYYRIEDQTGRRLWLYREGVLGDGRDGGRGEPPRWFLHGAFE